MKYRITANGIQKLQERVSQDRFKEWTFEMKALLKQQIARIREIEARK